jgi:hypothetical protein
MKLNRPNAKGEPKPGRHLLYAFIGWGVFACTAAFVLPPTDSRVEPPPLTFWSIITITALLAIYTALAVPGYLRHAWLKLPTVPNKLAYGLWIGLESVVLVAIEFGALYLLIAMLFGIMFPR